MIDNLCLAKSDDDKLDHTKCHNRFCHCSCHKGSILLSNQERLDLLKFLRDVGWISYEFHMPIHDLFERLKEIDS